jgi:hypothetical protein
MADPFTCPFCGAVSHNPNDLDQRYCGRCHVFVDDAITLRDETGACCGHETRSVRTTEHMEQCRACQTEVRHDLVGDRLLGFAAGCRWTEP